MKLNLKISTFVAASAAGFLAFLEIFAYFADRYTISGGLISEVATGLLVCLVASKLAFRFRQKQRYLYGAVEVGVGMATAGAVVHNATIATAPSQFVSVLAFLAAVYIGVRGFDNMEQAEKKVAEDEKKNAEKRSLELALQNAQDALGIASDIQAKLAAIEPKEEVKESEEEKEAAS